MSCLKKLLVLFGLSFDIFCYDDEDDDYDDDDEVVYVKKKKKIKKNKKIKKGRSGIFHTLRDKMDLSLNAILGNFSYIADNNFLNKYNNLSNTNLINKSIDYLSFSALVGFNYRKSKGIGLKIGMANCLQTQINRYNFKCILLSKFDFNLLLSLRIILETGFGYSFLEKKDERIFCVNGNNKYKLSDYYDTNFWDSSLVYLSLGVGFMFFSLHIGGEFSVLRLFTKPIEKTVDSKYKTLFNDFKNNKIKSLLIDLCNVELRFHPLILVDYILGWLI